MSEPTTIGERKARHLSICLDPSLRGVEGFGAGFESLSFRHRALPEMAMEQVDTSVPFLGRHIPLPVFISCMTGGSAEGFRVNKELALAAQELGIPVGTGSIRVLLEHPELCVHFSLKTLAPDVPLLANIGAVQVRGTESGRIDELVSMIGADALVVHLNPGQELFQEDGDSDFRFLKESLKDFIAKAHYPVIVKETGFGIHPSDTRFLLEAGAAYVDLAGSGGTNWIVVEGYRGTVEDVAAAAEFDSWGYRTAPLLAVSPVGSGQVLASGGVRSGMDVAKALALGAAACGLALPLAREAASGGAAAVVSYVRRIERVLRGIMLLTGSQRVENLTRPEVLARSPAFMAEATSIS